MIESTDIIDVAVVGGGPAGLAAAITAARAGARVCVLEARDACAHTIRPTGDGRCNISNAQVGPLPYRNPDFVRRAFVACKPREALRFLESCGLLLREEAQGRLYPQANKSTSVIEALLSAARRAGVQQECRRTVTAVRRNSSTWSVVTPDRRALRARAVVVAVGGPARGAGELLPANVPAVAASPVLAPLACDPRPLRGLDKIRAKAALTCAGAREEGEVLFRTFGLSGICAFNLSRVATPGDLLEIDFAPELPRGGAEEFLRTRLDALRPDTWAQFCTGMLLPQVAHAVLAQAGLPDDARPGKHSLDAFRQAWRAFPLEVRGVAQPDRAQVTRGGVDVRAIDPHTMQVEAQPGLFCAGEYVDVDGPCGGYNLHWAWTSGVLAGRAAAALAGGGAR